MEGALQARKAPIYVASMISLCYIFSRISPTNVHVLAYISILCTQICGRTCNNLLALSRHKKRVHSHRERPSCHLCDRVYHDAANLRRHIKIIHTTEERPHLPCTFPSCGKIYKNLSSLSRHVKIEHAEIQAKFRCRLCFKDYKTRSLLEQHVHSHKAYKCATCGRRFSCRGNMIRHEVNLQTMVYHKNVDLCIVVTRNLCYMPGPSGHQGFYATNKNSCVSRIVHMRMPR